MKIAVMGAGAIGGYIGGRLAAAGHDVSLIARGKHLEAIRQDGLRIESPRGDLHLRGIRATSAPAEIGPVDVILFTVKNADVETAAEAIRPMLSADTTVVTCQNGVSAADRLAAVIGARHVVPGVARFPGDIRAPGVIRHASDFDILIFGEADARPSARCQAFHEAMAGAGMSPEISDNIGHELWGKFVMQASLASMTALTRLNLGPLRQTAATADLFRRSAEETAAVARAELPDLPEDLARRQWDFVNRIIPADVHASMLDDLLRGKPIENEWLSGDVVRYGRKHGVPTPIHEVFAALLAPFEAGAPG